MAVGLIEPNQHFPNKPEVRIHGLFLKLDRDDEVSRGVLYSVCLKSAIRYSKETWQLPTAR